MQLMEYGLADYPIFKNISFCFLLFNHFGLCPSFQMAVVNWKAFIGCYLPLDSDLYMHIGGN